MADLGIVSEPYTVTLGALIDSYLTLQTPVAYGTVLTPIELESDSMLVPTVGQLYPK
ncbi:MAG: hypothetical protein V4611_02435 [Patescibacteria group bacterium]